MIKKFPDVPFNKIAPREGEIELFVSEVDEGKSYVEIENQGAYEQIAPGDSLTWKVKWYLRELPEGIKVKIGSPSLVKYVRKLIK